MVQAEIEQRLQAEPVDRLAVAGLGRDLRQQAMIEGGGIGALQDRGRRRRREPVEHHRHLLHARGENRAGDRREFAAAEAAQDFQRILEMRGMQLEPAVDGAGLARHHRRVGAGTGPDPVGAAAAEQRREDRRGGGRGADADVADGEQVDAAGDRLHAERHGRGTGALVEGGSLGEIAGRQMQREIVDLEAEIMGDADLVDRRAAGRASSTRRCVASTGRGETPWRATP